MPNGYAREYTPELTAQYLAGELGEIGRLGRPEEGRAVAEAASRGLLGQAQYGSMVGAARAGTAAEKSRAIREFNLRVAGLKREERLLGEEREYTGGEREREREFQERLAAMGYQFRRGEREAAQGYERVQAQQGLVAGGLMALPGQALGGYLGGRGGAAAGAVGGGGGGTRSLMQYRGGI